MLVRKFCYLIFILFLSSLSIADELIETNFVYIGESEHPSLLGVKQGIDESNLQGQFLNQKYNLDVITSDKIDGYDFSKYIAVLTSLNSKQLKNLAKQLSNTLIFNLADESNKLRHSCIGNILHISVSLVQLFDIFTFSSGVKLLRRL